MTERMWQMRKIGKGDYVCWSNDRERLWRFYAYTDGQINGLVVNYNARTFWLACWVPRDVALRLPEMDELPSPWDKPWRFHASHLATRADAVAEMLDEHDMLAAEVVGAKSP